LEKEKWDKKLVLGPGEIARGRGFLFGKKNNELKIGPNRQNRVSEVSFSEREQSWV